MLTRPVTENTIVVETDELLEVAKTAGLNAIKMPGEQDPVDFGDNLVIVIDDENGEFMAMSMAWPQMACRCQSINHGGTTATVPSGASKWPRVSCSQNAIAPKAAMAATEIIKLAVK